jgi:hypothetical protein
LSGRIARQTWAEFPPIEALAAPEVRIHPAPPVSPRCRIFSAEFAGNPRIPA